MRYLKTKRQYKASNFLFEVDGQKAWSYGWWLFSRKTDSGKIIFNNSTYSVSTNRHQSKGYNLLTKKPNLILNYTTYSLENVIGALRSEIKGIEYEIIKLIKAIKTPRSHKRKNEERKKEIIYFLDQIKVVEQFLLDEYGLAPNIESQIKIMPKNTIVEKLKFGEKAVILPESVIEYEYKPF